MEQNNAHFSNREDTVGSSYHRYTRRLVTYHVNLYVMTLGHTKVAFTIRNVNFDQKAPRVNTDMIDLWWFRDL